MREATRVLKSTSRTKAALHFFCAQMLLVRCPQYQCCYPGWATLATSLGRRLCSLAYCIVQALKMGLLRTLAFLCFCLLRFHRSVLIRWCCAHNLCEMISLTRSCIPPSSSELKKMHNVSCAPRQCWQKRAQSISCSPSSFLLSFHLVHQRVKHVIFLLS